MVSHGGQEWDVKGQPRGMKGGSDHSPELTCRWVMFLSMLIGEVTQF